MLNCDPPHVVFQECPNQIALCFSFYGCPLRCDGCHSQHLWQTQAGTALTPERFEAYLQQYKGLISAVVFFGGEWQVFELQALLQQAQSHDLITCLYTGLNHVSRHLRPHLDYIKTGPWREALGGLDQPSSNQKFYRLEQGTIVEDLTHLFQTLNSAQAEPHFKIEQETTHHAAA